MTLRDKREELFFGYFNFLQLSSKFELIELINLWERTVCDVLHKLWLGFWLVFIFIFWINTIGFLCVISVVRADPLWGEAWGGEVSAADIPFQRTHQGCWDPSLECRFHLCALVYVTVANTTRFSMCVGNCLFLSLSFTHMWLSLSVILFVFSSLFTCRRGTRLVHHSGKLGRNKFDWFLATTFVFNWTFFKFLFTLNSLHDNKITQKGHDSFYVTKIEGAGQILKT